MLALVCGLSSAMRAAWYEAPASAVPLESLAPRGAIAEAPTRVVWRSGRPIESLRIEWIAADGSTARRLVDAEGSGGAFALTIGERSAIERGGGARFRLVDCAKDGEWRRESEPCAVTLPASSATPPSRCDR